MRRQLIVDIEDVGGSVVYDDSLSFTLFKSQRVVEVKIPYASIVEIEPTRLNSFSSLSAFGLTDVDIETDECRIQCYETWFSDVTDKLLDDLVAKTAQNPDGSSKGDHH